jgi:hypothetical protein
MNSSNALSDANASSPIPDSALNWFPPIAAAGLPVPRTEFVPYAPFALYPVLDGEPMGDFPKEALYDACKRIGYPVFLRTDLASAKHGGPSAFKVDSPDQLMQCVFETFEDNCLKDIAGATQAFMVREYIAIQHTFTAFRGLPIGREWRFFADQEKVLCQHFYWPEEALTHAQTTGLDWRVQLHELAEPLAAKELSVLSDMALRAVRAIGLGAWSVDFALDVDGKWWLIDMATAGRSWHPKCCAASR